MIERDTPRSIDGLDLVSGRVSKENEESLLASSAAVRISSFSSEFKEDNDLLFSSVVNLQTG